MASIPIARYPSVSEMGYSPLGSFLEGGLSGFQTGYGLKRDTVDRKRKKELEDQRMQMQQESMGLRKQQFEYEKQANIDEAKTKADDKKIKDEEKAEKKRVADEKWALEKRGKELLNQQRQGDLSDMTKQALADNQEKQANAIISGIEIDSAGKAQVARNKVRAAIKKYPYLEGHFNRYLIGLREKSKTSGPFLSPRDNISAEIAGYEAIKKKPEGEQLQMGVTGQTSPFIRYQTNLEKLKLSDQKAEMDRLREAIREAAGDTLTDASMQILMDPNISLDRLRNIASKYAIK